MRKAALRKIAAVLLFVLLTALLLGAANFLFVDDVHSYSRVMLQELLAIDDDYRERLLVETANVTPEEVLDEARRLYNAGFPQVKASLAGKKMLKAVKARIDRSLSV